MNEEKELDKDINVPNKELTNEEVIKALENEKEFLLKEEKRTGNTPDTQLVYIKGEAVLKILDLIHHLQSENARLTEEFENMHTEIILLNHEKFKLQKQVDELTKPICGKFKDNSALLKAYKSLEKEYTRKTQKLRELQDEVLKEQTDLRTVQQQAVKDTAKKYHDAVKKLFDDADCCGWIEDSETKYWYEDNDKIAREQFGVEVE